jgi:hypothetical protein
MSATIHKHTARQHRAPVPEKPFDPFARDLATAAVILVSTALILGCFIAALLSRYLHGS